ncbi:MAG: ATP-binding protein [Planctomycetota bacterium]
MSSHQDLLSALRILPLRRLEDGTLQPVGDAPVAFLRRFAELRDAEFDLEILFPMLQTFRLDAEEFWSREDNELDRLRSGPWTQQDDHRRPAVLEATALLAGPERTPYLLIEMLGSEFAELREILQHARDQKLAHDDLSRVNEALAESTRRLERMAAERQSAISLLRESREQLEQRVAERTVELEQTNQKLSEESTQREHANRELRAHQDQLGRLAEQLAVAEERERRELAEFLHDRVGQNLALVKLRLRAMAQSQQGKEGSEETAKELGAIDDLMDEVISDTRSLTADLGTPLLYELGLAEAMQSLVRRFEEVHGIPARLEDDERAFELDEPVRAVIYQAVRELLHNIVKHAEAEMVLVRLWRDKGRMMIQVNDRGRGFDATDFRFRVTTAGGFGLFNIRERMQHLGGDCTVTSTPGQGTEVTLWVPLGTPPTRPRT